MRVQELYKRFLLMINKNDTNEGVFIPQNVFVLLFNSEALRWLAEELKKDEDNIDVNLIDQLLVPDFQVVPVNKQPQFIDFDLPDDYFQVYGSYSYCTKGLCSVKISNYEKKPGNIIPILQDADSKPSFDYEEGIFILANNKLRVYLGDFTIGDTFINYYREPIKIDMAGYTHFDGTESVDIDPELDDYNNVQILGRLATEIERQIENGEGFQFSKDRNQTEF